MHRSLNAGHRENYTQSVTEGTRKRDILAKRKDVLRRFSHSLPSRRTLTKANTRAANRSILQPVTCRNKNWLLTKSPSVSMNEDEEADADDLASEIEIDRTRQKIRRDLAKFRRRLQER
ncbi:hypothetical protein pdam_00018342, partial [Pocillopora damicornis]